MRGQIGRSSPVTREAGWSVDALIGMSRRTSDGVQQEEGREPVSHKTVRVIQDRIRQQLYLRGAPLPAQRELAAELKVSRTSLREALSTLEALGLVKTEAGRGTYVTYNGGQEPGAVAEWRYARQYDLAQVYEFRYLVEPAASRLAAFKITGGELARLGELHEQLKQAVGVLDFVASAELDFAFHRHIAACSGNPLFAETFDRFRGVFNESQRLPFSRHQRRLEPTLEHAKILEALGRHDPDACAYYMSLHIMRASERIGLRLKMPL